MRSTIAQLALVLPLLAVPLAAQERGDTSRMAEISRCCLDRGLLRVRTVQMASGYAEIWAPRVEGDELTGIFNGDDADTTDDAEAHIPIADISEIRVRSGGHALEGLAFGLSMGVTSAFLSDLTCDPDTYDCAGMLPAYVGVTAGATMLGTLIGAVIPKWSIAYRWKLPTSQ